MKIKTDREAIDKMNDIIRALRKHDYPVLVEQLDEIRQWLGRNE